MEIREWNKKNYENYSEKIKENTKKYYEDNSEKLICVCGSIYFKQQKNRHERSRKHQEFIFKMINKKSNK